jgi:hypothetical protein
VGRTEDIRARLRELEAELTKLARYGDDTYEVGTVLRFLKRYDSWRGDDENRDYTYAAIKTSEDFWYLSGRGVRQSSGSPRARVTWDELISFMVTGVAVETVEVATCWEQIPREVAEVDTTTDGAIVLGVERRAGAYPQEEYP